MTDRADQELFFREKILPKLITSGKLQNVNAASDLEILSIDLNFIGAAEAFMLTICYRVNLHYRVLANGLEERSAFVVKKTPTLPQQVYDSIGFTPLFNNEIVTYNSILQAIECFTQQPFTAPKYFYSEQRCDFGLMVLEDFAADGWQLCPAKYNLSLEHILLAVTYLAEFHGIGYAMKARDRAVFEALTAKLQESRYFSSQLQEDFAQQLVYSRKRLAKAVEQFQPQIDPSFLERFRKLLADDYKYGKARVQPREPLATICHGDYLRNNLAFRYDVGDRSSPLAVMMFDFQTMRLSSPMIDLTVLLSLSAFTEVRHTYFERIFNAYTSTLAATYAKYAKDTAVPAWLSHDSLLKEYTACMPFGISIASFFLLNLVEPRMISADEMFAVERTPEEIEQDILYRGGAVVDRELAHQVLELYQLSKRLGVDIEEGLKL